MRVSHGVLWFTVSSFMICNGSCSQLRKYNANFGQLFKWSVIEEYKQYFWEFGYIKNWL